MNTLEEKFIELWKAVFDREDVEFQDNECKETENWVLSEVFSLFPKKFDLSLILENIAKGKYRIKPSGKNAE